MPSSPYPRRLASAMRQAYSLAPTMAPTQKGSNSNIAADLPFRVELRGFEPLTPSMRTRCATGLRYSPENLSQRSKLCRLLVPRTPAPATRVKAREEALATAAEAPGTTTKKGTVNAALRDVGPGLVRLQARGRWYRPLVANRAELVPLV